MRSGDDFKAPMPGFWLLFLALVGVTALARTVGVWAGVFPYWSPWSTVSAAIDVATVILLRLVWRTCRE